MRKKYADCQRADGAITVCSLAKADRDCRDNLISKLEQSRRMAKLTQSQLAEKAGINIRQVQKIEAGNISTENITAKNIFALADALGVNARDLL